MLFFGTSHVYNGVLPIKLWGKCGITSHVLAQQEQPMIYTYYHIKEALKTQKPKLIICDVFASYLPSKKSIAKERGLFKRYKTKRKNALRR